MVLLMVGGFFCIYNDIKFSFSIIVVVKYVFDYSSFYITV